MSQIRRNTKIDKVKVDVVDKLMEEKSGMLGVDLLTTKGDWKRFLVRRKMMIETVGACGLMELMTSSSMSGLGRVEGRSADQLMKFDQRGS